MKAKAVSPPKPAKSHATQEAQSFARARSERLWVVFCITLLGIGCVASGTYLMMHNHESGGMLLISSGGPGTITGLIGLLSMAKSPQQSPPTATATATSDGGSDEKKK